MASQELGLALRWVKVIHPHQDFIIQRIESPQGPLDMTKYRPAGRDFRWVMYRLAGHLAGRVRIGPKLNVGGMTYAGVVDLDAHDEGTPDRLPDALALRSVLSGEGLSSYLERSKNGRGIHLWVFFESPVPVAGWARTASRALWRAKIEEGSGKAEVMPTEAEKGHCPFFPYYNLRSAESTGLTAFLDPDTLCPLPLAWVLDHLELNAPGLLKPKAPPRPRKRPVTVFDRLRRAGIIRPQKPITREVDRKPRPGALHPGEGVFTGPRGLYNAVKHHRHDVDWRVARLLYSRGESFESLLAWDQYNLPPLATDKPGRLKTVWRSAKR